MRKSFLAAGLVALLLFLTFTLYPKNQQSALADVVKAMSSVSSVHFTGWVRRDAGTARFECWKTGDKFKMVQENGDSIADNGAICTSVLKYPECSYVKIEHSHAKFEKMDDYTGMGVIMRRLSMDPHVSVDYIRKKAPNGREIRIAKLGYPEGVYVVTFDVKTGRLIRSEHYNKGRLISVTENYEYNIAVSNSLFSTSIPKYLPVVDTVTPPTETESECHEAQAKRLEAAPSGSHIINNEDAGEYNAKYHPGYKFMVVGKETTVAYLPNENVYRVLGKVIVYDTRKRGYVRLVQDEDIQLPGRPQLEKVLLQNGKLGSFCQLHDEDYYQWLFRWVNVGRGPLTITYNGTTGRYTIHGMAKLAPLGLVYRNQAVPMRFSNDLLSRVLVAENLDWAGLLASEVEKIDAPLDVERRLAEIKSHKDAQGYTIIGGGRHEGFTARLFRDQIIYPLGGSVLEGANGATTGIGTVGKYNPAMGNLGLKPAGPAYHAYYLLIPSKKEICIVGAVKVYPSEEIIENGLIGYDGTVISSGE